MLINQKKYLLFLFICLFLLLFASNCFASGDTELIQTITNKIETSSQIWHTNLRPFVFNLFSTLITITLAYSAIKMVLKGADLPELMTEIVTIFLLCGLWFYIIENSIDIVTAIINSFNKAANIATESNYNITPGDIINTGVELACAVIDQSGFWDTPIYGILALVLLIAYLFIAATLLVVLIESYIVTGAGIILLGFSGSPWTSDIAKKYLFFTLSVGIKLFVTIIVVGLGEGLVRDSLTVESSIKQIFAVIGVICLIAYLTNRIPNLAQSMIAGTSSSSTADVRGIASSAAKVAAGAALGALGTAAAGYQAHKAAMGKISSSSPTIAAAAASGAQDISSSTKNDNNLNAVPSSVNAGNSVQSSSSSDSSSEVSNAGDSVQSSSSSDSSSEASKRIQRGLSYLRAFGESYSKGTAQSIVDKLAGNKAFDTAKNINANMISDKIKGKSQ